MHRFTRSRGAVLGAALVLVLSIAALAAPVLSPRDPIEQDYDRILASPGRNHILGTDRLGRDTLSRLLYGARTSMTVGVLAQVIVLAVAIPIGCAAGYAGSRLDNLLMRGVDIVYAFPDLLLIILLRAVLGSGVFMLVLAIGLSSWPTVARLVRGQILSLRERDFVTAARSTGASGPHIVARHLLPHALGPVAVAVSFLIPKAMFAEAALSYIGIGIGAPTPSWGSMVQEGYGVIFVTYGPVVFPVAAIATAMLGFSLLSEGLRDIMDPRSGRRGPTERSVPSSR